MRCHLRILFGILCLFFSHPSYGSSSSAATNEELFRIGGSCAALAFIEIEQIRQDVGMALGDELQAFCYPEEPFDCADYTGFLKGLGSLTPSDEESYCRLRLED